MARRVALQNPTGMGVTDHGVMEIRGEIDGEPAIIEIPAKAAAYLIGGLASLASDQGRVTKSGQDLAVLPIQDAAVQSLVTRDGAFLVLRTRNGFQLTFQASVAQMKEIGTLLQDAAKRMRDAPPRTLS